MKRNKNTKFLIVILSILIFFIIILSFELYKTIANKGDSDDISIVSNEDVDLVIEDDYSELINVYETNKQINDDYVGQIYFESGLIDLPFVQGETNDTYLRTDWISGEYDIGGSVFLDSSNDIKNDQNIIIYGHNFPESYDNALSKMFTPLGFLKEKNYYEENKIINLFLGDRILKYEIVSVFRVGVLEEDGIQYINEGEPIYVLKNYSNDEFLDYIGKAKERQYYDTGVNIESSDRLLTLQTCFDDSADKLVVLAKLVEEITVN